MGDKEEITIDWALARALTRFLGNAIESQLYSGELTDVIMAELVEKVVRPGDEVWIGLSVDTVYDDIRMLKSNIDKGKDIPLKIKTRVENKKEVNYNGKRNRNGNS